MEILIHGTKDGYKILFKTTEFPKVFSIGELRLEGVENNRATVGSDFFSISFSQNGCIISKGICVWDEVRRAIGNIIFSIYIPYGKQLIGSEVKTLLDELCGKYVFEYITDGNISNKQEDWSLFESIANQYENKLKSFEFDDFENYQQGSREAAYVYYQNESELLKYLNAPMQEEYCPFKQVFFINEKLKGEARNPLNAIRQDTNEDANLTDKIDLENLPYKLNYESKNGIRIEVKVNGRIRHNKIKIKPKDDIEIIWSKRYCQSKIKSGKLHYLGIDYISNIDETGRNFTVKEIKLDPITHSFRFEVKNQFSQIEENANVNLSINGSFIRKAENNELIITAEELQSKCIVCAKKGNLISGEKEIRSGGEDKTIELILKEPKKVKFVIKDENGESITHNCTINIKNKQSLPVNGEFTFEGDDIGKKWTITIKHNKYEDEVFPFYPEDYKDTKHIQLKKKPNNKTGSLGNHQSFPEVNHDNGNKNNQSLLWIILVLSIVIIGAFIYYIESNDNRNKQSYADLTPNQIENYINGNDLSLRKLEQFKYTYCDKSNKDSEESLFEKLWPFETEENENSNYKFCEEVEEAISIRKAINAGDIDDLKNKKYSSYQKEFENAIKSISEKYKDKYKSQISDTLRSISMNELDLNKVAELINEVQKELTGDSVNNETKTQIYDQSEYTKPIKQPEKKKVIKDAEKNQKKVIKPADNKKENKTFEEDFWKLVHKGDDVSQNEFAELYDKYKNNHTDNEIFSYLKDLKNFSKFKRFKNIDELVRKRANKMEDLKK
jgi:hypothetical protein